MLEEEERSVRGSLFFVCLRINKERDGIIGADYKNLFILCNAYDIMSKDIICAEWHPKRSVTCNAYDIMLIGIYIGR